MNTEKLTFPAAYRDSLQKLADQMDQVWAEHSMSFVKAGDDKVYAMGGGGYVVVFDERHWQGIVEILTPSTTISVRPGDNGELTVAAAPNESDEVTNHAIEDTAQALGDYYAKRYWKTPVTD